MAFYLSPIGNSQIVDVNGDPLSGGKIYTYVAGSSTPAATYTDSTGTVSQPNPIILNSLGLPPNPIWLDQSAMKFIIKDASDVQQGNVYNDVYGVGASDVTASANEWVQYTGAVTYISPTSFIVVGDQTSIFHTERRLKAQNTSGLSYSTILTSVYSAPNTTVTIVNTFGALDSGLSALYYGLLSAVNPSIPAIPVVINQIQPISATVASNNLLITINPTTLDFRSATLTDGAITTENLLVPTTLTVPSGLTLGTTNNIKARLYVCAINVSGVITPVVINATTGKDLSETGVISVTDVTTGIIDGSDNFFGVADYTNIPYRLVGFIDITQTVAGLWATAPTLVQGAGGAARIGGFGGIAFRAYKNTTQSISATTFTKVTYQVEDFDYGSNFASNTFTAPSYGLYSFSASLYFVPVDGQSGQLVLYVNNVAHSYLQALNSGSTNTMIMTGTCLVSLKTGDTVDVYAYFSVAETLESGQSASYFSGVKLG